MIDPAPRPLPGPLERTCLELRRIEMDAVWRRPRVGRSRVLLRESDLLVDLVERCRERGHRLLPAAIWSEVVRFTGGLDPELRDRLGIDRRLDHVADVLFEAQGLLLSRSCQERERRPARIIPLFPHLAGGS